MRSLLLHCDIATRWHVSKTNFFFHNVQFWNRFLTRFAKLVIFQKLWKPFEFWSQNIVYNIFGPMEFCDVVLKQSPKVIINDNNLAKTMRTYFLPWNFFMIHFLLNVSHCARRRCALHSLKQTDFSVENCAKLVFIQGRYHLVKGKSFFSKEKALKKLLTEDLSKYTEQ